MYKGTVTSKGQITIPKQVREHLKLAAGEGLIFRIFGDEVKIERDRGLSKCPVCNGNGIVDTEVSMNCYFCDGTKEIELNQTPWELIASIKWRKYQIATSVLQEESDGSGFNFMQIPKVLLSSKQVPINLLEKGSDYIQMEFIKQAIPRSINNPEKFMTPSKLVLDEILDLLHLSTSKNDLIKCFD